MQTDYFADLEDSVAAALREDIGTGDITAELIDANAQASARVITRDKAVICGKPWVNEVFRQVDASLSVQWSIDDGQSANPNDLLFTVSGNARSILTAERCALNFLQTLSATATRASYYAGLVKHTSTRILDTRKTLPGLRLAQKYAVTCGGGENHRIGLYDAFLIKENHIAACGSITGAIEKARTLYPGRRLEIEVETMAEYAEAAAANPDWIMLDNFPLEELREIVSRNDNHIRLEASGGIETESDLVAIAETGVHFISIGALTKHCQAVDLSMRID